MTAESKLGKLEKVDLREQWNREDTDFTPWLADDDNLKFLGESIGMDLERVETEVHVGPFRADILCRDISSEAYVLIENQLESTDHIHLGQLMTYAAGLDTVHIIWVAKKFNDEHRAALDWLNRITIEGFHFFGIEVELWRIGDSLPAPKFNIVSKPNEWQKSVRAGKQAIQSERSLMYAELWTKLTDYLAPKLDDVECPKPIGMHWIRFVLNDDTYVTVSYSSAKKKLNIYLLFRGEDQVGWFRYVMNKRDVIERSLAKSLKWSTEDNGSGYAQMVVDFDHESPSGYQQAFALVNFTINDLQRFITDLHKEFLSSNV